MATLAPSDLTPFGTEPPRLTTLRHGQQLTRGSKDLRKASFALFLAGFSTFSLLYCVQPLLPQFSSSFGVDPATSSLALSLTTGALAFAILVAGAFSQSVDRRSLMFISMVLGSLLNIAAAAAPSWHLMLAARLVEGLVLGGVPAIAMAYLAEEMDSRDLAKAMGLYVAGTAFGAMMGRVGMGVLTDLTSWRVALGAVGVLGLATAVGFALLLPASRNFEPAAGQRFVQRLGAWQRLLRQTALVRLIAVGFILTSVSVPIYNYAAYRLAAAPYGFTESKISLIFLTFIFGMFASSSVGALSDRLGRRLPLAFGLAVMAGGATITLAPALPLIIVGISLVTIGFFISHSVASSWVGRLAGGAKSQAAALYLLLYYLGASITGSGAGWFWEHGGWYAVVALTGSLALVGMVLALFMREEAAGA